LLQVIPVNDLSVCVPVGLWKNSGSDLDAVWTFWHGRLDDSRDKAGLGIHQWKGVILGANMGRQMKPMGTFLLALHWACCVPCAVQQAWSSIDSQKCTAVGPWAKP